MQTQQTTTYNTDKEQTPQPHLWCIIMAGGLGSRFWPIAGIDSPKQFLDVMGNGQTMLQATFNRFARLCQRERIVIVTGENYVQKVHEQIEGLQPYQVLGEPLRRNTAPCIAYAAACIRRTDPEAVVVVTPSDHAIFQEANFDDNLRQAIATVEREPWIITLGAWPTRPDTNYGYIQSGEQQSIAEVERLHPVVTFTEKPPVELARQFISSGEFLWNMGLLVWKMSVLEDAYREHLPTIADAFFAEGLDFDRATLEQIYSQCEAISVDNGILEKASNVHVLTATFAWSDVETWETLYSVLPHDASDNAVQGERVMLYDSKNCMVSVADGRNIVIEGLDGYIVASTAETLMICRRQSEEMTFKFASDAELRKIIDKA